MKPYRLGQGCSITHGFAFSGMVESDDESIPIVVNIGNFKYSGGFRFGSTKIQRFDGEVPQRFRLAAGDVLVVMTCQTPGGEILGIPGRIPADGKSYLHNQRLGKVIVNRPDELDLGYLYYLFLSPTFNAHLVATATGSKILHTAPARIENFVWPRPPLPVQRRIAGVLSAYDDHIENNVKRIQILEEMARSLFHEWFVNFRFPGHEEVKMVSSALGKVPEGWDVDRLDSVLVLQRGFDLPVGRRSPGAVPVYAATGCVGTHDEAKVSGPGVLTGRSGSLGSVLLVFEDFWPLNTALWVKEFKGVGPYYAYFLLSSIDLRGLDGGAAVPTLNRNHVHALQMCKPPSAVVQAFEGTVSPMLEAADRLRKVNTALGAQRGLLLPRLVSGEVSVEPDA